MSWMDDPINEKPVFRNGKLRFSRVEVDVYSRGGTCKHIAECGKSKRRVVKCNTYVSAHGRLVL